LRSDHLHDDSQGRRAIRSSAAELDAVIRDIRSPKLLDWFIVNVVKPGLTPRNCVFAGRTATTSSVALAGA
jgi:hypothetical protein